jgi:acetyl-CoA C-acetyltransferase
MRAAAVTGTGQTRYASRRDDVNVCEMAREAALRAIQDAGLRPCDIDAVVVGSGAEVFEGINYPEHWLAPAIGATGKPVMRLQTGGTAGASATIAAFHHVISGLYDTVLAVAYQKLSDNSSRDGLSTCFDPLWDRDFSCPPVVLAGAQSRQYLDRHAPGVTEEHGAMVAVKNRGNAALNPYAQLTEPVTVEQVMSSPPASEPLKRLDCCPMSDGAVAMVIREGREARRSCARPAWFAGMGACSESYYVPHVDMAYPESCVRSAQQAYQMAWVYEPFKELDVAEVFDAFSFQELVWCEALGICGPGEAGKLVESGATAIDGSFPVNPSGGVLCANPVGAAAMVRQAEAAMQVMGRAGDHQVPGVQKALAHAWGGALQFSTVTIFASEL